MIFSIKDICRLPDNSQYMFHRVNVAIQGREENQVHQDFKVKRVWLEVMVLMVQRYIIQETCILLILFTNLFNWNILMKGHLICIRPARGPCFCKVN